MRSGGPQDQKWVNGYQERLGAQEFVVVSKRRVGVSGWGRLRSGLRQVN